MLALLLGPCCSHTLRELRTDRLHIDPIGRAKRPQAMSGTASGVRAGLLGHANFPHDRCMIAKSSKGRMGDGARGPSFARACRRQKWLARSLGVRPYLDGILLSPSVCIRPRPMRCMAVVTTCIRHGALLALPREGGGGAPRVHFGVLISCHHEHALLALLGCAAHPLQDIKDLSTPHPFP